MADQVNDLMTSCLSMLDARGYHEARKSLLERYGKPYKIAAAFIDRLNNGPQLKAFSLVLVLVCRSVVYG